MKEKVLISWVGNADLAGLNPEEAPGPLASILNHSKFDKVYVLSNYRTEKVDAFYTNLNAQFDIEVERHDVNLKDPTHYGDIYTVMDTLLKRITKSKAKPTVTIQVSSGTPSMTAVSILLGKAKYETQFLQSTKENGVIEPNLPFDVAADFHFSKDSNAQTISSLFIGETPNTAAFSDIITQSVEMETLKQKAAIIAKRDVPVLITGETGTGKELFAIAIHNTSNRKDKPLLILNCGAIPKDLVDTTLFGHVKGAFTGATASQEGYFTRADGGTLFLDEFGELPLDSQVRLLRVIQQGTFTPVGSTKEKTVDVRIITATNKNLSQEVHDGRFREDLFYRIAIGVLHLPPLRQRSGDISHLAKVLLGLINAKASDEEEYIHKKFSANAINFISKQAWNGNVRELQATILRATLWQANDTLTQEDISQSMLTTHDTSKSIMDENVSQGIDINKLIGQLTNHYVVQAMNLCNGNKTKAATLLSIKNYQTLDNWIKKYNIN
jgi:transcriptional regulator with GAF, ATPase, and Fis domain